MTMPSKLMLLLGIALFVTQALGATCEPKPKNKVKITYNLYVGDAVDRNDRITLSVPANSNFYQAMVAAAAENCTFKFTATDYAGLGHFINTISGVTEDRGVNKYWMIYITDTPPTPKCPPPDSALSPVGVDSIIVQNGKHYTFWYKTVDMGKHT
nr:putative conserved CG3556-like 1 protein [Limnephilus flavicornis]